MRCCAGFGWRARSYKVHSRAARTLLADLAVPVKRVAQRCGLGSEETMRRSFVRLLAVAPQDYRDRTGD